MNDLGTAWILGRIWIAVLGGLIAYKKNRSVIVWSFLAFFFWIFAIIAISLISNNKTKKCTI
jgi:hypothetical protein